MQSFFIFLMPFYGHVTPLINLIQQISINAEKVYCFGKKEYMEVFEQSNVMCINYPDKLLNAFKSHSCIIKENIPYYMLEYTRENMEWSIVGTEKVYEFACSELDIYFTKYKPDIIIYDSTAVWSNILAKRLKIPSICIEVATNLEDVNNIYKQYYEEIVLKQIYTEISYGLGTYDQKQEIMNSEEYVEYYQSLYKRVEKKIVKLAKLSSIEEFRPNIKFAYVSSAFHGAYSEGEEMVTCCGYNQKIPQKKFPRKGIYVTRGTVLSPSSGMVLIHILRALEILDIDVIASVGNSESYEEIVQHVDCQNSKVRIERFVNQLEVLKSCELFISHGGLTGIREAILCETPIIIYPSNYHDFQVGLAVEKMNIGIMIRDRELIYGKYGPLKRAIEQVLLNPSYKKNITKLKRKFTTNYSKNEIFCYLEKQFSREERNEIKT